MVKREEGEVEKPRLARGTWKPVLATMSHAVAMKATIKRLARLPATPQTDALLALLQRRVAIVAQLDEAERHPDVDIDFDSKSYKRLSMIARNLSANADRIAEITTTSHDAASINTWIDIIEPGSTSPPSPPPSSS